MSLLNKKIRGFTILEALIAIAIFAIVLGAVVAVVLGLYKAHGYSFQQMRAITEARQGVKTMIREIREARPGDDGSYIIDTADDFQFIFYGDIDKDGQTEKVRYFLDGNFFKKGVINPAGDPPAYLAGSEEVIILSQYVVNAPPIFRYFDGSLNELAAPARLQDTKLMRVYLIVNVDPNNPPFDFALESDIQLRNLKTNL